jgi:hypothetical protein
MACSSCSAEQFRGAAYCSVCGTALKPRLATAVATPGSLRDVFRAIRDERSGLTAALTSLLVTAALTWLTWNAMGWPGRFITSLLPKGDCSAYTAGTGAMYLCAVKIGFLTVVGPLALVAGLVALRVPLRQTLHRVAARIPPEARFLVGPVAVTLVFLLYWSGAHGYLAPDAPEAKGLLPLKAFPALVGVLAFAAVRYAPLVERFLGPLFDARDWLPRWSRVLLAVLIPVAAALLSTRQPQVESPGTREQSIVLLGLVMAYLLLGPRRVPPGERVPEPLR